MSVQLRIGLGYDVHQFASGRKLILGGVEIPFEKGLLGHSDAKFKDADSKDLLQKVYYLMRDEGYTIGNIDSTLLLEEPKIARHIPSMRKTIARILEVGLDRVSIKATTTEKLGFVGRKEGCAAQAIILIIKEEK